MVGSEAREAKVWRLQNAPTAAVMIIRPDLYW